MTTTQTPVRPKPAGMCPVQGCKKKRGPGKLVCYSCWKLVPRQLGTLLYAAFNNGNERDDYATVCERVLDLCAEKRHP